MRDKVIDYVESLDRRDWAHVAELLSPDVVYELPQTRERITGRDRYVQFNREYPGRWHLTVREAYGDEAGGVAHVGWSVDGGEESGAVAFFHFDADGLIDRVTDYWPEPYDPPPGREHLTERY
jgi:ketosteroid isomerase-like protein